jgi:hypothetical protein
MALEWLQEAREGYWLPPTISAAFEGLHSPQGPLKSKFMLDAGEHMAHASSAASDSTTIPRN